MTLAVAAMSGGMGDGGIGAGGGAGARCHGNFIDSISPAPWPGYNHHNKFWALAQVDAQ